MSLIPSLQGQVAIVTGGTGFLGASMCVTLGELGATVYALSRGRSKAFPSSAEMVICDLSIPTEVERAISSVLDEHRRIDVLINNAYAWPEIVQFQDATWESMSKTVNAGLVSQLYISKLVMDAMVDEGIRGRIINVASMYGKVSPDMSMYRGVGGNAIEYGATKAGLIQATRYMASVGGPHGIRANSISPGPFPRPGTFDSKPWFEDELKRRTMLGRVGDPNELRGVITFLATEMSSYVTGVDIPVDGGWTAW